MQGSPLVPGIIDSHFHSLEMADKGMNVNAILTQAFSNGLKAAIDICIEMDRFEQQKQLTAGLQGIYQTAGLYPQEAERDDTEARLAVLERLAAAGEIIAIGETGLDYYWNYATPEKQQNLCIQQIKLANKLGLPIIFHNRDADSDMRKILKEHTPEYGGILHCYSSDYKTAVQFLDLGLYISFAGNVTFKNAENIRETAGKIPINRILMETDAPYLSPVPLRGKLSDPEKTAYTYRFIAELRKIKLGDLVNQVKENVEKAFSINLPE